MSKHIVDLKNVDTNRDVYIVAKTLSNRDTYILISNSLEEAKKVVESEKERYYVYNSKGVIVYRKKSRTKVKINKNHVLHVVGMNVYTSSSSTIPIKAYHGTLIIADDRLYNDKYKVRTDEEFPIEYYCKLDDIRKYVSYTVDNKDQ